MSTADRRYSQAKRRAERFLTEIGREIRDARLAAGTSQAAVAHAARVSRSNVSRIESAGYPNLSLAEAVVVADAVGLDLSVKTYPGRSPTRDAAHARKLAGFLSHVRAPLRYATEVGLPAREGSIEQRAWDAMLFGADGETGIELEMRLYDVQAQARRIMLKWRDSRADRLLLLVNDTHANRRVINSYPEYFTTLPRLRTAAVIQTLERGERPPTGLILL